MFASSPSQEHAMPVLPAIAHPTLLIVGLVAIIVGVLLRRWASHHDLTSAVAGGVKKAAFDTVRSKGANLKDNPLAAKLQQVAAEGSHTGKAKVAAGLALKHFIAQAVGIAGLVAMLVGLAAVVAGIFWK
jgi:hypothetical protein